MSTNDKVLARITIIDQKGNAYEGDAELLRVSGKPKTKHVKRKLLTGRKPTATIAVKNLYNSNYFSKKRNSSEAIQHLSSKGMNFGESQILMALNRANYLNRGSKRGSYSYIQKVPPN